MPRKKFGPDLDKYLEDGARRYVSYEQGARMYSMPYYSFVRLTKDAQAWISKSKFVLDQFHLNKYINK